MEKIQYNFNKKQLNLLFLVYILNYFWCSQKILVSTFFATILLISALSFKCFFIVHLWFFGDYSQIFGYWWVCVFWLFFGKNWMSRGTLTFFCNSSTLFFVELPNLWKTSAAEATFWRLLKEFQRRPNIWRGQGARDAKMQNISFIWPKTGVFGKKI